MRGDRPGGAIGVVDVAGVVGGMVVAATSLAVLIGPVGPAHAAPVFQAPELVWESTGRVSGPQIVVDAAGRAHLFFQETSDAGAGVTLYHVDLDAGSPFVSNDVLVGLNADYRDYRVAADPFGNVHVLYAAQNQLWHAMVPGDQADDAGSWAEPISLGGASPGAEIAIDGAGHIHVCFPRGSDVRYVRSEDGGASWAQDALVGATEYPAIPVYLACAADSAGNVHVAWAEAEPPSFYPSKGTWYARSDDGGSSWSAPESVAGEHFTLPELLADDVGTTHMLWQGDVGLGGRHYRRLDADAAARGAWSAVEVVVPEGVGGMSGDAPLAMDGDGNVNVVTAAPEPVWVGRRAGGWGPAVPLATALLGEPNATGSIEQPAFAIQHGNVAHVAFEFDFKRIYYVGGLLDAAEARAVPKAGPVTVARRWARSEAFADAGEAAAIEPAATIADPGGTVDATDAISVPHAAFGDDAFRRHADRRWLMWLGPALALLVVAGAALRHVTHR